MAYFREGERLITLSQDLHEKEFIEQGINRYLLVVSSLEALVEAIEIESTRTQSIHIIVSASMGKLFRQHLEEVSRALNALVALNRVQVIEIGIGKVFDKALTFADARSFVTFCRNEERVDYIQYLEQQNEPEKKEESRILRDLMLERDSANERLQEAQEELIHARKEIDRLAAEYQELETKVNHVYVIELENAKIQLERKLEEQMENERLYKLEKAKVADYEMESSKYRSENKALQMDNASLKAFIEDNRETIRGLQAQIRALNHDIEKAERDKVAILKSRVDGEVHVQLSHQLEDERERVRKLQANLQTLEMNLRKKDFEIAENQREIEELRLGSTDNASYSKILDKVHLKATNVYYVKIITPLPYLRCALRGLYEAIKVRDGGRVHVCILKHDEGLNDRLYPDYELYGHIGDVQAKHEKFMLYPTRKMFTGAEKFDANVKSLLVLDFIQSNEYYIDTDGFSRVITVCRHSSMLHTLGLKGTPVSLDNGSLMDMQFDNRIATASTKEMQNRYIQMKVNAWVKNLDMG